VGGRGTGNNVHRISFPHDSGGRIPELDSVRLAEDVEETRQCLSGVPSLANSVAIPIDRVDIFAANKNYRIRKR
jgi:hypothetical protein